MIVIDALESAASPLLRPWNQRCQLGELIGLVVADPGERGALVELLAGQRTETAGAFQVEGELWTARHRKQRVVVLPRGPSLSPELSVIEHLELVASLRQLKGEAARPEALLQRCRIPDARVRPAKLDSGQTWRLTFALAAWGRGKVLIAQDPAREAWPYLRELPTDGRLLFVAGGTASEELMASASQVVEWVTGAMVTRQAEGAGREPPPLVEPSGPRAVAPAGPPSGPTGRLARAAPPPAPAPAPASASRRAVHEELQVRRFRMAVESVPATLAAALAQMAGVATRPLSEGQQLVELAADVSLNQVVRTMTLAGGRISHIEELDLRGRDT